MFKWFGSASKHPLANPRKAREMLSALPKDNPLMALEELSDGIESLSVVAPGARAAICKLFDEYSQPYRRKLGREYFGTDSVPQKRNAFALHRFADLLGHSYFYCIESYRSGEKGTDEIRNELPLLICRALNAIKSQYKWAHLYAGLIEESIWKRLYWLYAYAEKIGITHHEIALYPAYEHLTSVNQEFLKTLMITASSPDALAPQEFEIANHIVSRLSRHFVLALDANALHFTHYVDLSANKPPSRQKLPAQNSIRFFGPGKAYAVVRRLLAESTHGTLPDEVTLGGEYPIKATRTVLDHLAIQWAPNPPLRKNVRKQSAMRLAVSSSLALTVNESWISENISDSGYDAIIQDDNLEWEKIGLLFFSALGGSWDLCIIRRLNRDELKRWHVGVEILSKTVKPMTLKAAEGDLNAALLRFDQDKMEAEILVDNAGFSPSISYAIEYEEKNCTLVALEILEKGTDFKLWRFRVAYR